MKLFNLFLFVLIDIALVEWRYQTADFQTLIAVCALKATQHLSDLPINVNFKPSNAVHVRWGEQNVSRKLRKLQARDANYGGEIVKSQAWVEEQRKHHKTTTSDSAERAARIRRRKQEIRAQHKAVKKSSANSGYKRRFNEALAKLRPTQTICDRCRRKDKVEPMQEERQGLTAGVKQALATTVASTPRSLENTPRSILKQSDKKQDSTTAKLVNEMSRLFMHSPNARNVRFRNSNSSSLLVESNVSTQPDNEISITPARKKTLYEPSPNLSAQWNAVKVNIPRVIEYGKAQGILKQKKKVEKQTRFERFRNRITAYKARREEQRRYTNALVIPVKDETIIHSAIPFLPMAAASFCCVLNILVPGLGTTASGLLLTCFGRPRIVLRQSRVVSSIVVNFVVGTAQFFTTVLLLVGWGWSIAWGALMIIHAREYENAVTLHQQESINAAAVEALSRGQFLRRVKLQQMMENA